MLTVTREYRAKQVGTDLWALSRAAGSGIILALRMPAVDQCRPVKLPLDPAEQTI